MHQIDHDKGGCQICGIDTGSILRTNIACPGPLKLRADVSEIPKVDMGALQARIAGPLHVPNAPKPIQWKENMSSQDLVSYDKLLEQKRAIDAQIAERAADPSSVKKIEPLPPRTVE